MHRILSANRALAAAFAFHRQIKKWEAKESRRRRRRAGREAPLLNLKMKEEARNIEAIKEKRERRRNLIKVVLIKVLFLFVFKIAA